MSFKNMKIGMRLGVGFGIMMVLLAVLTFMGIRSMQSINGVMEGIVKESNVRTKLARDAMKAIDDITLRVVVLASVNDEKVRTEVKNEIGAARKVY